MSETTQPTEPTEVTESTAHEQVVPNHPVASATAAWHRSGLRRKKEDLWPRHGLGPGIGTTTPLTSDPAYASVTYTEGTGRDVLTARYDKTDKTTVTVTWTVTNDEKARVEHEVAVTDATGQPDPASSGSPLWDELLNFGEPRAPSPRQVEEALGD